MRVYQPEKGAILYHYCSAQTLLAMLGSRTIRFSDIDMMNDAQEGKWGYSLFEEAATRLILHKDLPPEVPVIPKEFFDKVDEVVHQIQLTAHPFIACFSREPDSLDQWRAYGDDGRGFSVGFSAEKLGTLPVTMFEVEYDVEVQMREVMALLLVLFQQHEAMNGQADEERFRLSCAELGVLFSAYKHPAFRSEKEVRCLHAIELARTPKGGRIFADPGGERDGVEFPPRPVGFYVRDGHLTAHVDLPMLVQDVHPVEAVITGPKNHSATGNLLLYLASVGLDDVKFGHSRIPYR